MEGDVASKATYGPKGSRVLFENEQVRVWEIELQPGETLAMHHHDLDYVVVPLTTGRLRMRAADGETAAELVAGRAYYRRRGVEHDVINANAHEFVFVEVEIH